MTKNIFISINNNIALRNWFYSGLINRLMENSDEISIITTNENIKSFCHKNEIKCHFIDINPYLISIINYYSNVKYYNNSTTQLIKKSPSKNLKYYFSKIFFIIYVFFQKKIKCDRLILTTMFGGSELLSLKLTKANSVFGSINSWDNPSSRSMIIENYDQVFVWSEYTKNSYEKFYNFNPNKIKIIGRLQDAIENPILKKENFHKIIGSKNKIFALIHGGSNFNQISTHFNTIYNYCIKNNYFLIFRGYSDFRYDFLNNKKENLFISYPSTVNIGANEIKGNKFDLFDFQLYNSILKYSEIVFTNGSTVLLDILRYNKKAYTNLNFFDGDDYKLFSYFHLMNLYWNNGFEIIDLDDIKFSSKFENIDNIRDYYISEPKTDIFIQKILSN